MIEILAVVSGIGTTIGVAKEVIDLFTSIRQILPKKADKPSPETLAMSKSQKQAWFEIEDAITVGRPVAERIVKKLVLKYGLLLAIVVITIAVILTVLFTSVSGTLGGWFWIPIFSIGCFFIPAWLFKNPLTIQISKFSLNTLTQLSTQLVSRLETGRGFAESVQSNYWRQRRNITNIFGGWISHFLLSDNDQTYLENYIRLCALRDSIQTFMIKEVVDSAHRTTQTAFRDHLTTVIVNSIEKFLDTSGDKGINPQDDLERYLRVELSKLGFDPDLAKFDKSFFKRIFQQEGTGTRTDWIKVSVLNFWQVELLK